MYTYLIMQNPGHSRVYYEQSTKLAVAELKIAGKRFENECQVDTITIANVFYIKFKTEKQITENELFLLSRLSFIFALFELVEINNQDLLQPVTFSKSGYIDPKISQLLKYSGKTNELFTKMMVNIGLLSTGFDYDQKIQLLDPVAGKGTTLFEGCVYGFDVAGIEINKNSFQEGSLFFKKFLEKERYKHKHMKIKGARKNIQDSADFQEFEYGATKEDFKDEALRKKLKFVNGDTAKTNKYFKKNSFHIIIGDLPYGISHGNIQKDKSQNPSRSPLKLLTDSLPEWHKVLKKDGVLVISWNKFVMPREDLIELLENNNFNVLSEEPYNDFEHKVDMSIKRDVIVAMK